MHKYGLPPDAQLPLVSDLSGTNYQMSLTKMVQTHIIR